MTTRSQLAANAPRAPSPWRRDRPAPSRHRRRPAHACAASAMIMGGSNRRSSPRRGRCRAAGARCRLRRHQRGADDEPGRWRAPGGEQGDVARVEALAGREEQLASSMSSPRRRMLSPGRSMRFSTRSSPSRQPCSCIRTASAPAGSGAPVKMRAAAPSEIAPATSPAATRARPEGACRRAACRRRARPRSRPWPTGRTRHRECRDDLFGERASARLPNRHLLDCADGRGVARGAWRRPRRW